MADLSALTAAAAQSEVVTDAGSPLAGIETGLGVDITNRIVDLGSNSDGEWIRFANGLQICLMTGVFSLGTNNFQLYPYPRSFSSSRYALASFERSADIGDDGAWWRDTGTMSVMSGDNDYLRLLHRGSISSTSGGVYICVIGKWN